MGSKKTETAVFAAPAQHLELASHYAEPSRVSGPTRTMWNIVISLLGIV